MMLYVSVLILFLFVYTLVYLLFFQLFKGRMQIENRVENLTRSTSALQYEEEKLSLSERILEPLGATFGTLLNRFAPKTATRKLARQLEAASYPKGFTTGKYRLRKLMLSLMVAGLLMFLFMLLGITADIALVFGIFGYLMVQFMFRFSLLRKIEQRKLSILRSLPFTLDLITVSVEAGLSFDGAIARVIANIKGELSEEFSKTLKEIRMGIERKVSLRNMAERCDIKELTTIISSIIQADELGVSLGKVLRIESSQLREKRKQEAREKAMKAPVKMLFPLVMFIFPSIFVIILGPAIIRIVGIF